MNAITEGLVQRLTIAKTGVVCVFIGPSPNNVEALGVFPESEDSANDVTWKNSMVNAIVAANVTHQKVWVTHDQNDSRITAVSLGGPFSF